MSIDAVRDDFFLDGTIYLNNASATPTPKATVRAMHDFLAEYSSLGPDSVDANSLVREKLRGARKAASEIIQCRPEEVVLTQSTTDGVNIVSRGISAAPGSKIVIRGGAHEHHANYYPWMRLSQSARICSMAIDKDGFFEIRELEDLLDGGDVAVVALSHALYNTGSILPVAEVGRLLRRHPTPFFVDAAQTVGCIGVDVEEVGCDFMAFNGSKWLCGPMGTGLFYCKRDSSLLLEPLGVGGESAAVRDGKLFIRDQTPSRFQAGFRNYVGIVGLEISMRYILRYGIPNVRRRAIKLANQLRDELLKIPDAEIFGPERAEDRTSIVSFNIAGKDPDYAVKRLQKEGIILAVREFVDKKFIRASPHFFNSESEIQKTADAIRRL